jgi:hypothetical protein
MMAFDCELRNMVTPEHISTLEYNTGWQHCYNGIASRLKSRYTNPAATKKAMDKSMEYAIAQRSSDMRFSLPRLMDQSTMVGASFITTSKVFTLPG